MAKHGMVDGGARGLISILFIFLLLIIFVLVFIIIVKENQAFYSSCNPYNDYYDTNRTMNSTFPLFFEPAVPLSNGPADDNNNLMNDPGTTNRPRTRPPTPGVVTSERTATPSTTQAPTLPPVNEQLGRQGSPSICDSADCVIKAGKILENSGEGLYDKCQKFVSYACDGWRENHPIPDHEAEYDVMKKTENEVALIMKRLLEHAKDSSDVDDRRASAFYHSCMNRTAIEEYGLTGIQQLIGSWPMLQPAWVAGNMFQYDLTDNIETSIIRGYPVFFDLYVGRNPTNVSVPALLLEEPELGMKNKEYYTNPAFSHKLQSYEELALKAAILLGAEEVRAAAEVRDMINFEIELAKILRNKPNMGGYPHDYRELRVSDFDLLTSKIDWVRMLDQTIKGVGSSDLTIGVLDYDFLNRLAFLINNTSVRTLGNYVTWKFILDNLDHLPREFQNINWWFEMDLHDTPSVPARWRKCLRQTVDNFPHTSEKMFYSSVTSDFDSQSITMVRSIYESVKNMIREKMVSNQWMDDRTRINAIDKINSMDFLLFNGTSTKMEYSNINVTDEPFLVNLLRVRPQKTAVNLRLGPNAVPLALWEKSPLSLRIYYDYSMNRIVVPAVAFHLPYFTPISTRSINYATIGSIFSREIINSFTKIGSNFDRSGNYAPWWSMETTDNYDRRMICLGERISPINITEVNSLINMKTRFEDLVKESMALDVSFEAFQRWSSTHPSENKYLPGIPHGPEELFFLSYAQMRCADVRKEKYLDYVTSAFSVPEAYRTNATLLQSSSFINTLRCQTQTQGTNNNDCALF